MSNELSLHGRRFQSSPAITTFSIVVLHQVLEMLSHVNKRVRDHREIGLPLVPLLNLFQQPAASPLVRNFALVYVEMAMERSSAQQRAAVLPELLQCIGSKPQQHQDMLLRMAMSALQSMAVTGATGVYFPHQHHHGFCVPSRHS